MENILIISPHPEDAALGCGGAICKHVADGDNVIIVFLTSGEKGGHGNKSKSEYENRQIREAEATSSSSILGISYLEFWSCSDGEVAATNEAVKKLQNKIMKFQINTVYAPHQDDDDHDHQNAALLAKKAIVSLKDEIKKPILLLYEIWTPIQKMDRIIDITSFIDTKQKAILAHKSQNEFLHFDEAALALNRYRGEMHSWPEGEYAEVFVQLEYERKQKILIDKRSNTVILKYDKNSRLYKRQKQFYSEIKHIKYVPTMKFKSGEIILNYCGKTLYELRKSNYLFTLRDKELIRAQLIELVIALFECRIAHRDLHIGNICWDGNQIWLIDWEFVCKNEIDDIVNHYDLTGIGLESPSYTNNAHLLKPSYQYSCINDLIDPVHVSLSDFVKEFSITT